MRKSIIKNTNLLLIIIGGGDCPTKPSIYQTDDNTLQLDVQVAEETVWLTQQQMASLFNSTIPNVSMHIRNIYKEGELEKGATVKDFLIVQNEGGRQVTRHVSYYNLDVIISVGYRVKSQAGTRFRQWANKVIKDYMLKGYAVNQRVLAMEERVDNRLAFPAATLYFKKRRRFDVAIENLNYGLIFDPQNKYMVIPSKKKIGEYLGDIRITINQNTKQYSFEQMQMIVDDMCEYLGTDYGVIFYQENKEILYQHK